MRVVVTGDLSDLERDLRRNATVIARKGPALVAKNAKQGNALARKFAKESSGPHGKNYFKRITAEALGPLAWEYGPSAVKGGNYVGAGWRSGVNNDLPRSADIQQYKLADSVRELTDGMFW